MRQLVALMLFWMALSVNAARLQLQDKDDNYATAGSEDIYFQPYSIHEISEDYILDEELNPVDELLDDEEEQQLDEEELQLIKERGLGDNLNAIDEDEVSCEYSCPRYYRPVCVRRDDELITFATPCEYQNQVRCANVAKRQHGIITPTFQLMYNNACRT